MTVEIQHATHAEMVAVSAAFSEADAVIVARIKAVAATVRRGVTVKTLAEDMAHAAESDDAIVPVGAAMLGYAYAVTELVESFGMSPASALKTDRAAVVEIYRAIVRVKSKAAAFKVLKAAGKTGETDAERLAAMHLACAELKRPADKRRTPRPPAPEADAGDNTGLGESASGQGETFGERARQVEVTALAISGLITAISRDGFTVSATDAHRIHSLMAELSAILPADEAPAVAPRKVSRKAAA